MIKTGKVKWFDTAQGYGFMEPDEGEDIFLHYKDLKDENIKWFDPEEGEELTVKVVATDEGLRAVQVVDNG